MPQVYDSYINGPHTSPFSGTGSKPLAALKIYKKNICRWNICLFKLQYAAIVILYIAYVLCVLATVTELRRLFLFLSTVWIFYIDRRSNIVSMVLESLISVYTQLRKRKYVNQNQMRHSEKREREHNGLPSISDIKFQFIVSRHLFRDNVHKRHKNELASLLWSKLVSFIFIYSITSQNDRINSEMYILFMLFVRLGFACDCLTESSTNSIILGKYLQRHWFVCFCWQWEWWNENMNRHKKKPADKPNNQICRCCGPHPTGLNRNHIVYKSKTVNTS